MDLWNELTDKLRQLGEAVRALDRTGKAYAEARRDYEISKAQEALKLKDQGMAVTLIDLVVHGQKDVAMARFKKDVAESTWKANQELVNQCKLEAKILESQLEREWSIAK